MPPSSRVPSKPADVAAYDTGHDWGGTVAWDIAMNHLEVVDRLAAGGRNRDDQPLPVLGAAVPKRAEAALRPIQAPTLVVWGQWCHRVSALARSEPRQGTAQMAEERRLGE
jgi:hypothetical protein